MNKINDSLVTVFAGTPLDAGMIHSLLEEEGIPAFIQNELMGSIAPWQIVAGGAGAVKVQVSNMHEEQARQIINDYNLNIQEEV
ncbi:DUF2007 domain-containing protein [Mucilaginibacter terrae]|uniref:putative signal transducing protein n=1 Tax=Mucilaginibacter terrae TaxID=1955052 RepID=UPI00363E3A2F